MSDVNEELRDRPCYYSVLGLRKQATEDEIRGAYRKLAMKWHPDRWMKEPKVGGEAKRRFQEIQEAYSVLCDKGKRKIYDAGLFGLLGDDDDDDEGFVDFMQEMVLMMQSVGRQEENTLEDLQELLVDMMWEEETVEIGFNSGSPRKRKRVL